MNCDTSDVFVFIISLLCSFSLVQQKFTGCNSRFSLLLVRVVPVGAEIVLSYHIILITGKPWM
jgi:hypothetical protein